MKTQRLFHDYQNEMFFSDFIWLFLSFVFSDHIAFAGIVILVQISQTSTLQDGKDPACSALLASFSTKGSAVPKTTIMLLNRAPYSAIYTLQQLCLM